MGLLSRLISYFTFLHLRDDKLRAMSAKFTRLAVELADELPYGHPQTEQAFQKLVEAKDCAVRALLPAGLAGDALLAQLKDDLAAFERSRKETLELPPVQGG